MSGAKVDCIADTNAIINLSRREPKATAALRGKNFAVAFVTLAELLIGVGKAQDQESAYNKIEPILRGRKIFYPSEGTILLYAELYCDLERKGRRIPTNDLWIAILALEKGLPLIARDAHFARVEGLSVTAC